MFDKENMKSIWCGDLNTFISTSLYFEPLVPINKTSWPCVFEFTRVDCTVASYTMCVGARGRLRWSSFSNYISYYSLSVHTQLWFITHWIYKTRVGVACDLSFFRKMSVNKSTRTFKKIDIQYSFYTQNRKIYVTLITQRILLHVYTMDHSKFIVSNQKEEFISK